MYSTEGLTEGIKHAKKNIKVLEDAIIRERNTIKEYRIMIDTIKSQKDKRKEIEKNVEVVCEREK